MAFQYYDLDKWPPKAYVSKAKSLACDTIDK